MFERTIIFSLTSWYCGFKRHALDDQGPHVVVARTVLVTSICSRMVGAALRLIGSSTPSRLITAAAVPVDLATVTMPASRSSPAMIRVTVDLAADSVHVDAEVELVDPASMRERFTSPTREKREAHEVPADDCQWHDDFIGILDSDLKASDR